MIVIAIASCQFDFFDILAISVEMAEVKYLALANSVRFVLKW